MTDEYVTHFLDEVTNVIVTDTGVTLAEVMVTLCGLPVEAIILNERPPTCTTCIEVHRYEGWLFPLPATVVAA